MHIEELKKNCISMEKANANIFNNNGPGFEWYSVKNKKGYLLEVGGTHTELKIYISLS